MVLNKTYAQLNIVQTYVGDHKVRTYGFNYIIRRLMIVQTYEDNHDVLWFDNLVHVKTLIVRTHVGQKDAIRCKHV